MRPLSGRIGRGRTWRPSIRGSGGVGRRGGKGGEASLLGLGGCEGEWGRL